jgi:hypothetical protein
MITLELLKETFGEESEGYFRYLSNKQKGGNNNSKGNIYENYFAVFQIAKSFNENCENESTFFSTQFFGFIDDLLVEQINENKEAYFQIKDTAKINWNSEPHWLQTDFLNQYEVLKRKGVISSLTLVVSNQGVFDHLKNTLPERLKGIVEIVLFETGTSVNNLIRNNAIFKEELKKMCALTNPSADKLETLGTIILGAWDGTAKKAVSLGELLDRCHQQNPNYIKGQAESLSNKLNDILKSIDGFSFEIEKGYLRWRYRDTDMGVFSYALNSKEFLQMENDIFNTDIKCFEDLESFLST